MTTWNEHVEKWRNGCGSCLCQRASKVVLARGQLPCDVCFVGEAPGAGEDAIGLPFVGPAGKLQDRIIVQAGMTHLRIAFCNLVGCIPLDEFGSKEGPPSNEAISQCQPRLEEFLSIASPKLVVAVGQLSTDYLEQGYTYSTKIPEGAKVVSIKHPAFILRSNVAQRGLLIQRSIITLQNAVEDLT